MSSSTSNGQREKLPFVEVCVEIFSLQHGYGVIFGILHEYFYVYIYWNISETL